MPEKITKEQLKKNKFRQVAESWNADPEKVKKFLMAMERTRRMVPGVGGPRPMVIRDRQYHKSGDNLILNPIAQEAAHKLFVEFSEREAK